MILTDIFQRLNLHRILTDETKKTVSRIPQKFHFRVPVDSVQLLSNFHFIVISFVIRENALFQT